MQKYKLVIQYLGDNYSGSQIQPNQRTIQGELNKAIRTLTKQNTSTIFQGRTDKGVSAKCQVVHFRSDKIQNIEKFLYSINSILDDDIKVIKMTKAKNDFHAQMSATYRHYQYKIRNAKQKNVFDKCTLFYKYDINLERMNEALSYLVGEHDFSAFKSTSENPACVCKIYEARATKLGSLIKIDIVGNRFLYNMVRTIVGTLLMFEKNSTPSSAMRDILNSKNRENAGPVAQADGLTLFKVGYNKYKKGKINENI